MGLIGGGIGITHPVVARIPMSELQGDSMPSVIDNEPIEEKVVEPPFTIAEAKRRLALSLGVNESDIKITINS